MKRIYNRNIYLINFYLVTKDKAEEEEEEVEEVEDYYICNLINNNNKVTGFVEMVLMYLLILRNVKN